MSAPSSSLSLVHSSRVARISRRKDRHEGHLTPLAPGAYVLTGEWEGRFVEDQLLVRADAARDRWRSGEPAVESHATAAARHGLPLYRVRSDRVDVIVRSTHPRHNSGDIRRHFMPLPAKDVVLLSGVPVTSLARTVYDAIRTLSLEAAVVVFDAALRQVAWDDTTRTYDESAAAGFRQDVWHRILGHAGARGIRQARFVTDFADGRAQLPGESIARLWMSELGVPRPRLQHRVEFDDGGYALLDFCWPRLRRWVEFDGEVKYIGLAAEAGLTRQQVVTAQREREERIRRQTGWRCDRWGFESMRTIDDLARLLAKLGLLEMCR